MRQDAESRPRAGYPPGAQLHLGPYLVSTAVRSGFRWAGVILLARVAVALLEFNRYEFGVMPGSCERLQNLAYPIALLIASGSPYQSRPNGSTSESDLSEKSAAQSVEQPDFQNAAARYNRDRHSSALCDSRETFQKEGMLVAYGVSACVNDEQLTTCLRNSTAQRSAWN